MGYLLPLSRPAAKLTVERRVANLLLHCRLFARFKKAAQCVFGKIRFAIGGQEGRDRLGGRGREGRWDGDAQLGVGRGGRRNPLLAIEFKGSRVKDQPKEGRKRAAGWGVFHIHLGALRGQQRQTETKYLLPSEPGELSAWVV